MWVFVLGSHPSPRFDFSKGGMVQITSLGHAGFLVETEAALIVADPWLSGQGAFDGAWMPLPRNEHLAPWVAEKLSNSPKERYLYLSHEHSDHYDPVFLDTLKQRDFTLILPRFRRPGLEQLLAPYGAKRMVSCEDGQSVPIPGGSLRLFLTDQGLNRDSSLLIHADGQRFLNLNDCKIHDRLPCILEEEGSIDVFTAQFSGAIWHPTCYEYDRRNYEVTSRKKMFSKFEAVSRALEALQPKTFLASAGPVCFLDPALIHLNFERVNIFPRANRFFAYLEGRLREAVPKLINPMPGDVFDVKTGTLDARGTERVEEEHFERYVRSYAEERAPFFAQRKAKAATVLPEHIFTKLKKALEHKLVSFPLRERIKVPLYVSLKELPHRHLRVDFQKGDIREVAGLADIERYTLQAAAGDLSRVLEGALSWEAFLLSFRLRLSRTPDHYDALLHGFLALEAEDLPTFSESVLANEARQERTLVSAGGRRYAVNRFCPHQGADLSEAWVEKERYLVCPRHRWRFDLQDEGRCSTNGATLRAQVVEESESFDMPPRIIPDAPHAPTPSGPRVPQENQLEQEAPVVRS